MATDLDRGGSGQLAEALDSLSMRLAALGRRGAAIATIEESIGLYEVVAATHPRWSPRPLEQARRWLRSLQSTD